MLKRIVLALALWLPALAQSENVAIDRLVQSFTEDWLRLKPDVATMLKYFPKEEQLRLDALLPEDTPEQTRRQLDVIRRYQAELRKLDLSKAGKPQRVAARVLERNFNDILKAEPLLGHSYVLTQGVGGPQNRLISLLTQDHSVRSTEDARAYLARLGQVARLTGQWMEQSKAAEARGVIAPRSTLSLTARQIRALISPAAEDNLLVGSLRSRLKLEDSASYVAEAKSIVADSIYPAWQKLAVFLEEQAKRATEEAGLWKAPGGGEAYSSLLRSYTSTELTAEAIHQLGLKEVSRIEAEMDRMLRGMGLGKGSVNERYLELSKRADVAYPDTPDVRERVLADYDQMIADARKRMQTAFRLPAWSPVVARRIEAYREANSSATYRPSPSDGSQPSIFYVPLRGPRFERLPMKTLVHHEAIPGHHFQNLHLRGQNAMPAFLRQFEFFIVSGRVFGGSVAFSEGWGLYAQMLADEMGLFEGDAIGRLGYLRSDLFRAARLVVDTGIHARRWTRQQAIDYLKLREPQPGYAEPEVERYIERPGQACAYKIGQLKILELRAKAKKALGARFDLKDFHAVVLGGGNVPLPVLEELVDEYIRSGKN